MPIDYATRDNYFIVQLYGEDSLEQTFELVKKGYEAYQKVSPSNGLAMITSLSGRTPSVFWDKIERIPEVHDGIHPKIHAIYAPGNPYLFENAKLYASYIIAQYPDHRWKVFDKMANLFRWLKKVEEKMKIGKNNSP